MTRVVAEFRKNSREVVRAQVGEYRGAPNVSLWVFTEMGDGRYLATNKGLSLSPSALPQLEDAVRQLRKAADAAAGV